MSKQFKLVYEKDGIVKGNYEGVPAGKDAPLIERAVLEGKKPVTPAPVPPGPEPGPTPTGTISITENGEYDVTEYAGAKVEVPTIDPVELIRAVTPKLETEFNHNHESEWPYLTDLISFPGQPGCYEQP